MKYGRTIELGLPYEQAVPRVKEAFAAQGFGTLTEIDVRSTLKEKLGQEMEPYLILGTCNPELAHRALEIDPAIGLLLPCNVVVRSDRGRTLVQALNPQVMVAVPERTELQPIADEAAGRIQAALTSLSPPSVGLQLRSVSSRPGRGRPVAVGADAAASGGPAHNSRDQQPCRVVLPAATMARTTHAEEWPP